VTPPADTRRIAGLLLAAGLSRRMASGNKLIAEFEGAPLVRHPARTLCAAGLKPVLVVIGHEGARVRRALEGLPVRFIDNPAPAEGMAASLKCGVRALPAEVRGVVVALGDMPHVRAEHIAGLLEAFEAAAGEAICVPVFEGRRGHPVLFPARLFAELEALEGDVGARAVLARHAAIVREVAASDDGVLFDVDSEAELAAHPRPPRTP